MSSTSNAYPELERDLSFHPIENPRPQKLTQEQVDHYNEFGYISPLDVYSREEADTHRAFFDEILVDVFARGQSSYSINGWHRTCRSIHDLVTESRILDYVQDLLGGDLICWGTHYFCKMPGESQRVSWHQDASYWPLSPAKTATVWLAIDDADEDNGAMRVIPGSHRHGQIDYQQSSADEHNVLNQTVRDPLDYGGAPVALAMRAGQISLHTDLLLHGSEPNRSERRRCGLTMRFVPPDVRAYEGWGGGAVICRGSDPSGVWAHCSRPEGDILPASE